jgi:hypothetical protein
MNPSFFCYDFKRIKAFVLGADPTNFSDNNQRVELITVFGIGSGNPRYFNPILKNLNAIGLTIFDVYVQNIVQEYQQEESGKNKSWKNVAAWWLPKLKEEFDKIHPAGKIPVLVTAEMIFKFLSDTPIPSANEIYSCKAPLKEISKSENNKLARVILPFHRHPEYSLGNKKSDKWRIYKSILHELN